LEEELSKELAVEGLRAAAEERSMAVEGEEQRGEADFGSEKQGEMLLVLAERVLRVPGVTFPSPS